MNTEPVASLPSTSSVSTEETHPLSLPLFLSASSSSLKPLRERNRTNLKRRINLSRSQVLSNDFENEDTIPTINNINKITTTTNSQSQPLPPSTPTPLPTHTELYTKTISPTTPSPIHTTVTCSQVWERLASNEEHQTSTSPKANTGSITPTTSSLPTHISFSYDPSDDDDDDDDADADNHLLKDDKDDFQYVPVSSQSKLVQFQFLSFVKQQQLDLNDQNDTHQKKGVDYDDDDEDEDDDEENTLLGHLMDHGEVEEEEEQENRSSNKRKRSVSSTDTLDDISSFPSTTDNPTTASSSLTKPPCTKKPKLKDPNANFQRLNMRKKNYSHAKKHQFAKHKRNAFYRRMRNAGGK